MSKKWWWKSSNIEDESVLRWPKINKHTHVKQQNTGAAMKLQSQPSNIKKAYIANLYISLNLNKKWEFHT